MTRARRRPPAPFIPLVLVRPAEKAVPGARAETGSMHRQIYEQIRALVLGGDLAPGTRLPATRALARELGCSRNTVLAAYEQLLGEGYLEGARGAGTYVSRILPDTLLAVRPADTGSAPADAESPAPAALSRRGAALAGLSGGARRTAGAFVPGVPDLDLFPFDVWGRLLGRTWRRPRASLLRDGDPAGHGPLRQAIADYLRAARALRCDWRQVLITSGAQQALDLVVRALLDPGDAVWCEDPGYPGLRGPLEAAGARFIPVPLDGQGLSLAAGRARAPEARLAVVAPSHQFPLGIVMSLARRLELLQWARAAEAWILEDDYDSEYRYAGRPLAALQGLDTAGRVIYLGTFSKVLFPALRLGYLIVPEALVEPVSRVRAALDGYPSAVVQPALAAFIEDGHFAAHVRRMRARYAARQEAMLAAARRHLSGLLDVAPDDAGMHLVARIAAPMGDRAASARAAAVGIAAPALSDYAVGETGAQGLLLGYAAVPEAEIEAGIATLGRTLSQNSGLADPEKK